MRRCQLTENLFSCRKILAQPVFFSVSSASCPLQSITVSKPRLQRKYFQPQNLCLSSPVSPYHLLVFVIGLEGFPSNPQVPPPSICHSHTDLRPRPGPRPQPTRDLPPCSQCAPWSGNAHCKGQRCSRIWRQHLG